MRTATSIHDTLPPFISTMRVYQTNCSCGWTSPLRMTETMADSDLELHQLKERAQGRLFQ